jgi:hypothetical protein
VAPADNPLSDKSAALPVSFLLHLDNLAAAVLAALLAHAVRAHQLAAILASDKRGNLDAQVAAAIAPLVARDLMFR